jgi:hypothetical protein
LVWDRMDPIMLQNRKKHERQWKKHELYICNIIKIQTMESKNKFILFRQSKQSQRKSKQWWYASSMLPINFQSTHTKTYSRSQRHMLVVCFQSRKFCQWLQQQDLYWDYSYKYQWVSKHNLVIKSPNNISHAKNISGLKEKAQNKGMIK